MGATGTRAVATSVFGSGEGVISAGESTQHLEIYALEIIDPKGGMFISIIPGPEPPATEGIF
jgi:hypothetical protein